MFILYSVLLHTCSGHFSSFGYSVCEDIQRARVFTGTRTRERPGRSQAPKAQKAEAGRVPSLVGGYLASKAHLPSVKSLVQGQEKKAVSQYCL